MRWSRGHQRVRAWSRGYQRVEKRPREAGGERKGLQDEAHTSGQLEGWNQESHRISAREGGDGRAAKGVCSARETWRWAWVRRRRRLRIQREKEVHEHGGPWAMRVAGGGRDPVCRSLRVRVRSGHQCPWTVSSGLRRGEACVCKRETDPGVGERASERDWGRLGVVGGRVRRACCREPQEFRVTHIGRQEFRNACATPRRAVPDCASTRGAARPR